MSIIWNALQSPSFWKAVVGFATAAGLQLAPDQENAIISVGLAIMGAINAWHHAASDKSDTAAK